MGIEGGEFLDKKLEVKEGVELTKDEQDAVDSVNKFLSKHQSNSNSEKSLYSELSDKSEKRISPQEKLFIKYMRIIESHINLGQINYVDHVSNKNNIYKHFDIKDTDSQRKLNSYLKGSSYDYQYERKYENFIQYLEESKLSNNAKNALKDYFFLELEGRTSTKQNLLDQYVEIKEEKLKQISDLDDLILSSDMSVSEIKKNSISQTNKLNNAINKLNSILNSCNSNIKQARKVKLPDIDNPQYIYEINTNKAKALSDKLKSTIKKLKKNKDSLAAEKKDLMYQKYKEPIDKGLRFSEKTTTLDLSNDSIGAYKTMVHNLIGAGDHPYYFKQVVSGFKKYVGDSADNKKYLYKSSRGNPSEARFSSIKNMTENDIKEKGLINPRSVQSDLLEFINFEHSPTIDQIKADSSLLQLTNIKDFLKPTTILNVYSSIQKIDGLSDYGQAVKTKRINKIRSQMPQNFIENEYVEISDGFTDNLHQQLKDNPKCYIGFDGEVHGGSEEERKSIEVVGRENLQTFIKKDFALLANKYVSYDHFMIAMNSQETSFSGKNELSDGEYKKLYNYIKHGAPVETQDYKFSQIGSGGQCKEIKELQGLLHKLDPRLSNKLNANNNSGVDGKYGFATAETFRSLSGVLNQSNNEIEYFAQFSQVYLFQDVSGSMDKITSMVSHNINMYNNGETAVKRYGENGHEQGLDELYDKLMDKDFYNELLKNPGRKLFRLYTDEIEQSEVAKDATKLKGLYDIMKKINGECDIVACEYSGKREQKDIEEKGISSKIIPLDLLVNDNDFRVALVEDIKGEDTFNILGKIPKNYFKNLRTFNLKKAPETALTTTESKKFLYGILQISPSQQLKYANHIKKKCNNFGIEIKDIQNLWKASAYYATQPQSKQEQLVKLYWDQVDGILSNLKQ